MKPPEDEGTDRPYHGYARDGRNVEPDAATPEGKTEESIEAAASLLGSRENFDKFKTDLSSRLRGAERPRDQINGVVGLLDETIEDRHLTEAQQEELYRSLATALPQSKLNEPIHAVLNARMATLDQLREDELFEGGQRKDYEATGIDVPLARQANRQELERRLKRMYGLNDSEGKKLATILRSPSHSNPERLSSYLRRSFTIAEMQALQTKIVPGNTEQPLNDLLSRGLSSALKNEAPTVPIVPRGTFVAEPENGRFMTSVSNFTDSRSQAAIKAVIEEPGTHIYLLGATQGDIDRATGYTDEQKKRLHPAGDVTPHSRWSTDYRGLPISPHGGVGSLLLNARYYHRGSDISGVESGLYRTGSEKFPYYLEGGNISSLTNRDGKRIVAIGESYVRMNGLQTGAPRIEALAAAERSFAADARLVVLPGQDDGTGHVDMFMKPVGPGHVFVGDYRDADIDRATTPSYRNWAREADSLLDESARRLETAGVRVSRVPQIPSVGTGSFSKLNSIYFTNGEGERVAIVPNYPHHPLNDEINELNIGLLHREGFSDVKLVDTDLNFSMGVFHCILPQIHVPPAYSSGR